MSSDHRHLLPPLPGETREGTNISKVQLNRLCLVVTLSGAPGLRVVWCSNLWFDFASFLVLVGTCDANDARCVLQLRKGRLIEVMYYLRPAVTRRWR